MKKALAMALGAVLAAGSAAPASAATQIDFSGFYTAHYMNYGNLNYAGGDDANLNDSFFESRLRLNLTFQATDEVSVHWRMHAPNGTRWGRIGGADGNFVSRFYYGQVVQDWGTIRVGRLAGGLGDEFGLSSLGWAPALDDQFTYIAPFEGSTEHDSIQYSNSWDNGFGLTATYSKIGAKDYSSGWNKSDGSDHDADRFQIQGTYQWDTGGVALNTYYLRDATANGDEDDAANVPVHNDKDKTNIWFINPAFAQSWGAFSTHFEGLFAFGETSYHHDNDPTTPNRDDSDADGMGFYLDFDYNYGPGRVNLAGWWVDGNDVDDQTDNDTDNNFDNHSYADIVNGNFYPLVVAYGPISAYVSTLDQDTNRGVDGAVGVANAGNSFLRDSGVVLSVDGGMAISDIGDAGIDGVDLLNMIGGAGATGAAAVTEFGRRHDGIGNNRNANHWALMLSGQHAFTDEITFNYALAYLSLVNPNYSALDSLTVRADAVTGKNYITQDKDLGWEIDLGVNVQLLDNLAFTSTFGYMFTGDAYKQLQGYRVNGPDTENYDVKAKWEDADNAYSWLNSLTFSF